MAVAAGSARTRRDGRCAGRSTQAMWGWMSQRCLERRTPETSARGCRRNPSLWGRNIRACGRYLSSCGRNIRACRRHPRPYGMNIRACGRHPSPYGGNIRACRRHLSPCGRNIWACGRIPQPCGGIAGARWNALGGDVGLRCANPTYLCFMARRALAGWGRGRSIEGGCPGGGCPAASDLHPPRQHGFFQTIEGGLGVVVVDRFGDPAEIIAQRGA